MATTTWPNLLEVYQDDILTISSVLPFNKSRTKAIHRIGPHNLNEGRSEVFVNNGLFSSQSSTGLKVLANLKVLSKALIRQLKTQVKQNLPEIGNLSEDFIE